MRTVWLAVAVASSCVSSVNPDEGRFSCASSGDCGTGWECRLQLAGGGRCFKLGVCRDAEVCNGLDDDCNGAVDESFDLTSDSAHCGACDRSCDGGTSCRASACRESRCDDGVDNDFDGLADCADAACRGLECTPPLDGGRCGALLLDGGIYDGGVADGGAPVVRACFAPEHVCSDRLDDDGDGLIDCLDPDCDGRSCDGGTLCASTICG